MSDQSTEVRYKHQNDNEWMEARIDNADQLRGQDFDAGTELIFNTESAQRFFSDPKYHVDMMEQSVNLTRINGDIERTVTASRDDDSVDIVPYNSRTDQKNITTIDSAPVAQAVIGALDKAFENDEISAREAKALDNLRKVVSRAGADGNFDVSDIQRVQDFAGRVADASNREI